MMIDNKSDANEVKRLQADVKLLKTEVESLKSKTDRRISTQRFLGILLLGLVWLLIVLFLASLGPIPSPF